MRIWSLHPKYLDAKGLVALWRETLLAKHVLQGRTKGYTGHPQLVRFKGAPAPVEAIDTYLMALHAAAVMRGYRFDISKVDLSANAERLTVTTDQLAYETTHLLNKLKVRDPARYKELARLDRWEVHPLFKLVKGGIAPWEKVPAP